MDVWLFHYYRNMLHNQLLKAMYKHFNQDIKNKCVLGVDLDTRLAELFIYDCLAELCICIGRTKPIIDNKRFDFVEDMVYNKLGIFEEQYDVVYCESLDLVVDDVQWQQAVSNLCFYLKPGGMLFIPGNFGKSYVPFKHIKLRSLGVCKGIIKNCGCDIKHIIMDKEVIDMPLAQEALIVVKK